MTNLWDIFTAKAEYTNPVKDKFGRATSLVATEFDSTQPVVSQRLFAEGFKPFYPNGKQTAVCLSHDIDVLLKPTAERARRAAFAMKRLSVRNALVELQSKHHPQWELRHIYELEMKHDARSTFFFLSLEPGERDFNYDLHYVANDVSFLNANGFEVALHGNFNAATDAQNALVEKQRLEKISNTTVTGYRNHYLCFDIERSWQTWQQAGIKHDSTFGFANMPGFRNGMCYPFQPFDLTQNQFLDIVELPLMVMDATLFNYLRLDVDNAFKLIVQFFETVQKVNGVFTLLWHNHFMHDEFGKLYERLLGYFNSQNAWMTSHAALTAWWDQSNFNADLHQRLLQLQHG